MDLEELEYDAGLDAVMSGQAAEADRNLAVRFFLHPLQDMEESEKAKRPIFRDTPFIEIRVKGDRNNIIQRPVREHEKVRFRAAWKAFEAGEETPVTGTPLAQWPTMTKSMIEELKYFGFQTVEDLANASDTVMSKFPGLSHYKNKAKLYIEYALKDKPIDELQRKMDEKDGQIGALASQNKEMNSLIEKLSAQVEALQKRK